MAIYHCSIKIGSRSSGRSACAASAYRAGEKIEEYETGITHDYTKKSGVIYSEINLPEHAPQEYADRATLWNAVQEVEKASNAQLFREVEVALPVELTREQQIEAVRDYVQQQFVKEGMCADWALHDKGDGNPHAHIMLTTRPIKENGEWGAKEKKVYKLDDKGERIPVIDPKTGEQKFDSRNRKQWERETVQANDWNDKGKAEVWREAWANECNKYLEPEQQIDHRSYERQGIEREPTHHVGVTQQAMKEKGKELDFDKTAINAEIQQRNSLMQQVREAMLQLYETIREKARELYERVKAASRDHGYAQATGELAYDTGTTAGRNRVFNERERGLERLVRETAGTDQYAKRSDREIKDLSEAKKEKGAQTFDRIGELLQRSRGARADKGTGTEHRGQGDSPERELGTFVRSLNSQERASEEKSKDSLTQRTDRDDEQERLRVEAEQRAAAERRAALEAERKREEARRRAKERSRDYGPSL